MDGVDDLGLVSEDGHVARGAVEVRFHTAPGV
jgi:hypothetical protein